MYKIPNGGIAVKIGSYTLDLISSFSPSWEDEVQREFENWDFSTVTVYKGKRWTASITSGTLDTVEKDKLLSALSPRVVDFSSPDFSGPVRIENVSAELSSANFMGHYWVVSFTAAAVELSPVSGGL